MPTPSPRSRASRERSTRRWYVYLVLCRSNAIYTGIALDVAARYAQHVAGTGARYTRANPPCRLLASVACANQSAAGRLEAAIKRLSAAEKRNLIERLERNEDMPAKEPGFAERLQTAAKAKQAQLEKMRATKQAGEPHAEERQAEPAKAPPKARKESERKDAKPAAAKKEAAGQQAATKQPTPAKQQAAPKTGAKQAKPAEPAADTKARKEAERLAKAQAEAKLKQEKTAREAKYPAHKTRKK